MAICHDNIEHTLFEAVNINNTFNINNTVDKTQCLLKEMSVLLELTFSCTVDEYYINNDINNIETVFKYGVIITMESVNYCVTTYVPNHSKVMSCKCNGINYKILSTHGNYFHNITAFLLERIPILNIYLLDPQINMQYTIQNMNLGKNINTHDHHIYIMTTNVIKDAIELSVLKINYEYNFDVTKNKLNIIDKMKLIINIENDIDLTQLFPGNAVYNIDKLNIHKLLGIIESVEYTDDDSYIIKVIPSYVIVSWLTKNNMSPFVHNMYIELDDNNAITQIHHSNSTLKIGDVILSVNKCPLNTFNMIRDVKLLFDIPLSLYVYYNYGALTILELLCLRNDEIITIHQELLSLDKCMKLPYNNINYCCTSINNYKIKTLSMEILNYLMTKNIYIKYKQINMFYDKPFQTKTVIASLSFAFIINISLQHTHGQPIIFNLIDIINSKKEDEKPIIIMIPLITKVNTKKISTAHEIALIVQNKNAQLKLYEKCKASGINMNDELIKDTDITLEISYNNDKFMKRIEI